MKKIINSIFAFFIFAISFVYANPVDELALPGTEQAVVMDKDIDTITNPPKSFNEDFLEYYSKQKSLQANVSKDNDILPHLYMLHINGINTSNEDAVKNKDRLEAVSQVSGTSIGDYHYVVWDFVYNPTGTTDPNVFVDAMHATINLFENIADVAWQKA